MNKTENKTKQPSKSEAYDTRASLEKLAKSIDELSKTLVLLAKLVGNGSKSKNKQEHVLFVKGSNSTINKISTISQEQTAYNKSNMANKLNKRVSYKKAHYKKNTKKDYQTDFILH